MICLMLSMMQRCVLSSSLIDFLEWVIISNKAYATAGWGSGWDSIQVNPSASVHELCLTLRKHQFIYDLEQNPGSLAQACYPNPMLLMATWNSNLTCKKSSANFTGYIVHSLLPLWVALTMSWNYSQDGLNAAQVQVYQGTSVSASTMVECELS